MIVNLFGGGPSRMLFKGRKGRGGEENWYVNRGWENPYLPAPDMIFYLDHAVIEGSASFKDWPPAAVVPRINGRNFPTTEVLKSVPGALPLFSSTVCYALAYAAYEEVSCVRLWGIDLQPNDPDVNRIPGMVDEHRDQLPGVMFWLGVLSANGIEIEVAWGSAVFVDLKKAYGDLSFRLPPFKFLGEPAS